MKLFNWMHRKLQKESTGSFKGSAIGCSSLLLKQEDQSEHYLNVFKAEKTEEINEAEPTDEIFPGFLTIGTLSVETTTDPPTPTFDMPYQETDAEAIPEMKYDLKLINDELEKFLKAEGGNKGSDENELSMRKSSCASTVSLIGNENEEDHQEGENKFVVVKEYPLQGYLLASSTEPKGTKQKAKKEKTYLKKLLQKSTIALRSSHKSAQETQKETKKEFESSTHVMTMTLQEAESSPTVQKLKMIKRFFHKKIHPEASTAKIDLKKCCKYDTKKILKNSGYSYPISALGCECNRMSCWGTLKKEENHHSKIHMNVSQDATSMKKANVPSKGISDGAGREHWIKTDADYLVLEL